MVNQSPIKSLSDYIKAVNYISHIFTDHIWFRGHPKCKYKNLPTIYREDTWLKKDYCYAYEYEVFKNFKRKCKINKESDYEYLHLMQHYGLPTRLLDWTESSLIALFFAIHDINECQNPTVWVIDPYDFNKVLHRDSTIYFFYGNKVHEIINSYINPKDDKFENIPVSPIAVLPSFYDERVIAQKSCFVLFGNRKSSLEELVLVDEYFNLAKIIIDTRSAFQILIDLNLAGIDYHTVYPDIYGLVQEIKRLWELK